MPSEPKIEDATRFGRIPFDLYALEHWNYDAPEDHDAEQWKTLGRSYREMQSLDRRPYHDKATNLRKSKANRVPHPKLNYGNIERVLNPFQTRQERHASELSGRSSPICVQTCYDEELTQKLCDLVFFGRVGVEEGSSEPHMSFFDEKIYNFENDSEGLRLRLLERMPGLCDQRRSHYRENHGRSNRRLQGTLEGISNRMATYVLFADREAIERDLVKVMWLDDHGECLAITKMAPNEPIGMRTMFGEGFSMLEAIEMYGLNEEDGVMDVKAPTGSRDDGDDNGADDSSRARDIALSNMLRQPLNIGGNHVTDQEARERMSSKLGYEAGYAEGLRVGMHRGQSISRGAGADTQ